MLYIAKEQTVTVLPQDKQYKEYQLFTVETTLDVNGVEVQIPKLLGWYTLERLEKEKQSLLELIQEIDNKIATINNLE